jgi:hypothetical protein
MNEYDQTQPRDAFFSKRIRAGKRTYYFDVKATRGNDFYITITESKRKPGESEDRPFFEKHKLFLYKEDFEKFTDGLNEALDFIKHRRSGEPSDEMSHIHEASTVESITSATGFTDLNFEDLSK